MRIAYHAGLILLLAACENPSVLDGFDRPTPPPWQRISEAAQWLDPPEPNIDLHTWLAMDHASQVAALEAWADAKTRYAGFDVLAPPNALSSLSVVAYRIAKDPSSDDRALAAALYLAQRMRRDDSTLTSGAGAASIAIYATRRPRNNGAGSRRRHGIASVFSRSYSAILTRTSTPKWRARCTPPSTLTNAGSRTETCAIRRPCRASQDASSPSPGRARTSAGSCCAGSKKIRATRA